MVSAWHKTQRKEKEMKKLMMIAAVALAAVFVGCCPCGAGKCECVAGKPCSCGDKCNCAKEAACACDKGQACTCCTDHAKCACKKPGCKCGK